MKSRRPVSSRSASSKKSGLVSRSELAPIVRGPWGQVAEMGAREFVNEAGLSTSGGDFGFAEPAKEQREAR